MMDEREMHVKAGWRFTDFQLHGFAAVAAGALMALQSLLPRFSGGGLIYAGAFVAVGFLIVLIQRKPRGEDDIKEAKLDRQGFLGLSYKGKKIDFGWSEMSSVKFDEDLKKGFIEIEGRGLRAVIHRPDFTGYGLIRQALQHECDRNRVKYQVIHHKEEKPRESAVRKAKRIIADAAAFDPRKVFRIVMAVATGFLFLVHLATWGSFGGWVAVSIMWTVLAIAWINIPRVLPMNWLRLIEITVDGLYGETFKGAVKELRWKDIKEVTVFYPSVGRGQKLQAGKIIVDTEQGQMKIGAYFPRFSMILVEISKACGNKRIKLTSTGRMESNLDGIDKEMMDKLERDLKEKSLSEQDERTASDE